MKPAEVWVREGARCSAKLPVDWLPQYLIEDWSNTRWEPKALTHPGVLAVLLTPFLSSGMRATASEGARGVDEADVAAVGVARNYPMVMLLKVTFMFVISKMTDVVEKPLRITFLLPAPNV